MVFLVGALFSGVASGADAAPEALLEAGHFKRLRDWAEPLLAANPNDAQAAYYVATVKEETGDADGALPLAEKAMALDPNNARYHLLVANICIRQAQKAGVFKGMGLAHRFRDEASKAASLDSKNVDAREALMEFYFEAPGMAGGDKKKAWALADEIGKIDPARGFLAQANLAGKEKIRCCGKICARSYEERRSRSRGLCHPGGRVCKWRTMEGSRRDSGAIGEERSR